MLVFSLISLVMMVVSSIDHRASSPLPAPASTGRRQKRTKSATTNQTHIPSLEPQSTATTLNPSSIRALSSKDIQIIDYLDAGRYSTVFNAVLLPERSVVVKVLKPHDRTKIQREVSILRYNISCLTTDYATSFLLSICSYLLKLLKFSSPVFRERLQCDCEAIAMRW
jgi:hypothetical protein